MNTFQGFPKIARLSRTSWISEKIDGTNAQVFVWDECHIHAVGSDIVSTSVGPRPADIPFIWSAEGIHIAAGSRTRWITPTDDNHGFAKWVLANVEQLVYLGHGIHFGEWWGSGIQRGYGLTKGEKRWSLFNLSRWCMHDKIPERIETQDPRIEKYQDLLPPCCDLVPLLYKGVFTTTSCDTAVEWLRTNGSLASPGFMRPEGIVCWHGAANIGFKKTLLKDEVPKSVSK